MRIDQQIAFVDELLGFANSDVEREALGAIRETLVEVQVTPSACGTSPKGGQPTRKKVIKLERYQEFVGAYDQFCRKKLGAPAHMNAANGRALKETVDYLMKQEKVNGDELLALEGWQYMFDNWSLLSEFIQKQVGLLQIKKNIQEILFEFRNASKSAKRRHSENEWDQLNSSLKGE
jgi:hypothetical protein